MTAVITHTYQSSISEGGGSGTPGGLVGPNEWNANHTITGTVSVAQGGTGGGTASGTLLDNITGFSSTGYLKRTGSGTYTFVTDPSDVTTVSNSDSTLTISPTSGAVVASLNLGNANTWTAKQTFNNGFLALAGSSSGSTLLEAAATASGTISFPAVTDTVAVLGTADQTVSGGANVTSNNLGTKSSGTLTIDCGKCPLQYVTNGGAFTLAAPSNDGSSMLLVTNNGSAGTITFSGFTVGSNTGDSLDTTNTHLFTISIWRINGTSGYRIAAHQ